MDSIDPADRCRYACFARNGCMLQLQFFSGTGCERVYADIEQPPTCAVCESGQFERMEPERQAMSYFTRS